jgi:hypothetical protein
LTPADKERAHHQALGVLFWAHSRLNESMADPVLSVALCHSNKGMQGAIILMARAGIVEAHNCLWAMAFFLNEISDSLPLWLQRYVVASGGEERPIKPGRDPAANIVRDALIAHAVEAVTQQWIGMRPTRNNATTVECGCSIVKKALEEFGIYMTEAAVTAIWRKGRSPLIGKCERGQGHVNDRSDSREYRLRQWWLKSLEEAGF